MTDKQLLEAAARALGGKDWEWWTSNSFRRLVFKEGRGRHVRALHPSAHPKDGWPDVSMAAGVQEFIELASPKAVLAMAEHIAQLEAVLLERGGAKIKGTAKPTAGQERLTHGGYVPGTAPGVPDGR